MEGGGVGQRFEQASSCKNGVDPLGSKLRDIGERYVKFVLYI